MADSTQANPAQFPLPDEVDPSRRDVIMIAAGGFAAVGLGLGLWPLLDMMNSGRLGSVDGDDRRRSRSGGRGPSDHGDVARKADFFILRHRTKKEIEEAKTVPLDDLIDPLARNANLPDEAPASDENRAGKDRENWLVMIGICTHLGCIPQGQSIGDPKGNYDGWFCPCHGSQYDSAGRVRVGPAPQNMAIPPYAFTSDTKIKIG